MSSNSGKADGRRARKATSSKTVEPPARRSETASYIAIMCGELAVMANGADLGLTGHFLAIAKAEAERLGMV